MTFRLPGGGRTAGLWRRRSAVQLDAMLAGAARGAGAELLEEHTFVGLRMGREARRSSFERPRRVAYWRAGSSSARTGAVRMWRGGPRTNAAARRPHRGRPRLLRGRRGAARRAATSTSVATLFRAMRGYFRPLPASRMSAWVWSSRRSRPPPERLRDLLRRLSRTTAACAPGSAGRRCAAFLRAGRSRRSTTSRRRSPTVCCSWAMPRV